MALGIVTGGGDALRPGRAARLADSFTLQVTKAALRKCMSKAGLRGA